MSVVAQLAVSSTVAALTRLGRRPIWSLPPHRRQRAPKQTPAIRLGLPPSSLDLAHVLGASPPHQVPRHAQAIHCYFICAVQDDARLRRRRDRPQHRSPEQKLWRLSVGIPRCFQRYDEVLDQYKQRVRGLDEGDGAVCEHEGAQAVNLDGGVGAGQVEQPVLDYLEVGPHRDEQGCPRVHTRPLYLCLADFAADEPDAPEEMQQPHAAHLVAVIGRKPDVVGGDGDLVLPRVQVLRDYQEAYIVMNLRNMMENGDVGSFAPGFLLLAFSRRARSKAMLRIRGAARWAPQRARPCTPRRLRGGEAEGGDQRRVGDHLGGALAHVADLAAQPADAAGEDGEEGRVVLVAAGVIGARVQLATQVRLEHGVVLVAMPHVPPPRELVHGDGGLAG
ncbi:hypothetical protein PG987_009727 [Apiospora arundinis]